MVNPIRLIGDDGCSTLDLYGVGSTPAGDHANEGGTYKFVFSGPSAPSAYEPSELFEVDPDDRRMGRLRPANHVGTIAIAAETTQGHRVAFNLDVQPAKLTFESEYRALLEQVADHAAEAVLQGFAPASRMVSATSDALGELEYRSLAFIAARLRDESFLSAAEHVMRSPHRQWKSVEETAPAGKGARGGRTLSQQLAHPRGRTQQTPQHLPHLPATTVPQRIMLRRNESTFDTAPNRFVRFVFRHWQGMALSLERKLALASAVGAGPRRRGITEARWVIEQCDRVLSSAVMKEVGDMRSFPHGDPVLLRQPGYREILRTFALAEASIALDAQLDDDIFSATQRNIATLYEYWTFLVLVRSMTSLCGDPTDGTLFMPSASGLSLVLREGSGSRISWTDHRAGRKLAIDLWFNQTFSRAQADGVEISSWASSIRPDASLRIRPVTGRPREAADPFLDVWIHFDAKFRLDLATSNVDDEDPRSTAKRTDLLKMHAYRDLIRRSAGAYVLYPGFGEPQQRMEYHEVLPGIGAFPLRPGPDGAVAGVEHLTRFLRETLDLAANQGSANERVQFWRRHHTATEAPRVRPANFLSVPPADEIVMLGYVRNEQRPWVLQRRRYNVRADSRAGAVSATDSFLSASLLLLWGHDTNGEPEIIGLFERTGPWQIATAAELRGDGYPAKPTAQAYLVAAINPIESFVDALVSPAESLPLPKDLRPYGCTWGDIARRMG